MMASFLNQLIKVAIPSANKLIEKHKLVVPKDILGIFSLTDLRLNVHDNYLDVGATPIFKVDYEKLDERFLFSPIHDEPYYPTPKSKNFFSTFFLEQLGADGEYLQSIRPNFQWQDMVWDQLRIFFKQVGGLVGFLLGF